MEKTKFSYWNGLVGVHDSMELDSGQSVAELEWDWLMVELRVCGDVRVVFDGTAYRSPSQFPEELMEMFHKGTADQDERVCIDMNNWFEVFVYEKRGDEWSWTDWSDIIDADWKSAGDIYDELMLSLESYVEEYWLDHAHEVMDERFPDADEEMKENFICEEWQNLGEDDWNCKIFTWRLGNGKDNN